MGAQYMHRILIAETLSEEAYGSAYDISMPVSLIEIQFMAASPIRISDTP